MPATLWIEVQIGGPRPGIRLALVPSPPAWNGTGRRLCCRTPLWPAASRRLSPWRARMRQGHSRDCHLQGGRHHREGLQRLLHHRHPGCAPDRPPAGGFGRPGGRDHRRHGQGRDRPRSLRPRQGRGPRFLGRRLRTSRGRFMDGIGPTSRTSRLSPARSTRRTSSRPPSPAPPRTT